MFVLPLMQVLVNLLLYFPYQFRTSYNIDNMCSNIHLENEDLYTIQVSKTIKLVILKHREKKAESRSSRVVALLVFQNVF